jgi:hypothetical protein
MLSTYQATQKQNGIAKTIKYEMVLQTEELNNNMPESEIYG